ncbi:hypothetical protein BD560DRAFT_391747 [Blakeslea trispora]|nr:hypothetical protein BD560DRAFT_391747 [Blakeslea trispora]
MEENCVFNNEAGFSIHIRRNFGRSKRGQSAKAELPNNQGITITIVGAICEKEMMEPLIELWPLLRLDS